MAALAVTIDLSDDSRRERIVRGCAAANSARRVVEIVLEGALLLDVGCHAGATAHFPPQRLRPQAGAKVSRRGFIIATPDETVGPRVKVAPVNSR